MRLVGESLVPFSYMQVSSYPDLAQSGYENTCIHVSDFRIGSLSYAPSKWGSLSYIQSIECVAVLKCFLLVLNNGTSCRYVMLHVDVHIQSIFYGKLLYKLWFPVHLGC